MLKLSHMLPLESNQLATMLAIRSSAPEACQSLLSQASQAVEVDSQQAKACNALKHTSLVLRCRRHTERQESTSDTNMCHEAARKVSTCHSSELKGMGESLTFWSL